VKTLAELLLAEASTCDFKEMLEVRHPKSWLKTVSAFANGPGGVLLFGVADDKKIIGLTDIKDDIDIMIQASITEGQKRRLHICSLRGDTCVLNKVADSPYGKRMFLTIPNVNCSDIL